MFRRVLLSVAVTALFAPTLLAQGVTVCVFQGKESHDLATQYASDIQNVAAELTGKTLPSGASIQAIAVPDVSPKEQDPAAQSHQCGYIVSVWREEMLAAPAGISGNMSGGGLGGAHNNDSAMQQTNETRVGYSLRKTGTKKKLVNGESDKASPWIRIASDVVKKLARDEG